MVAGNVRNLHTTRISSTTFTVAWNPSVRSTGYAYTVRDLNTHRQVGPVGHTNRTIVTIPGLQPGHLYNFGIQALPGGMGNNIHVRTATSGTTTRRFPIRIPSITGGISYRAFAAVMCVRHGWGLGQQWTDWQWIEMHEAGWNPNARNLSSGAYGIAQALGHGNANTVAANGENNYGNFGTSDTVCRAANSGNGYAQVIWMGNYLAIAYGSPSNARAKYNMGY